MDTLFSEPPGWRWNEGDGKNVLRSGSLLAGKDPVSEIVIGHGLREFPQKYFKAAMDFAARGHNVHVIAWRPRLRDRFHREAGGFDNDARDLVATLNSVVRSDAPKIYLGHSMGAMIGATTLVSAAHAFNAAVLLTPFLGFHDRKAPLLERALTLLPPWEKLLRRYVPGGGGPFTLRRDLRNLLRPDDFSSHAEDMHLNDAWTSANPELQVGGMTLGCFLESCRAIAALERPGALESIAVPTMIVAAGQDKIVPRKPIDAAANRIPGAFYQIIPDGKHELLMEKNEIRAPLIANIHNFIVYHRAPSF